MAQGPQINKETFIRQNISKAYRLPPRSQGQRPDLSLSKVKFFTTQQGREIQFNEAGGNDGQKVKIFLVCPPPTDHRDVALPFSPMT